eukprot:695-Heterococcus_DN1.PRE.3
MRALAAVALAAAAAAAELPGTPALHCCSAAAAAAASAGEGPVGPTVVASAGASLLLSVVAIAGGLQIGAPVCCATSSAVSMCRGVLGMREQA